MNKTNIDFSELQDELMTAWEDNCVKFIEYDEIGFQTVEGYILPEFQDILDDPMQCIYELGFDSIASYIASKNDDDYSLKSEFEKTETYPQYLEYLKRNKIIAPQWVHDWAKENLK